jgi:hypothetical protein
MRSPGKAPLKNKFVRFKSAVYEKKEGGFFWGQCREASTFGEGEGVGNIGEQTEEAMAPCPTR